MNRAIVICLALIAITGLTHATEEKEAKFLFRLPWIPLPIPLPRPPTGNPPPPPPGACPATELQSEGCLTCNTGTDPATQCDVSGTKGQCYAATAPDTCSPKCSADCKP